MTGFKIWDGTSWNAYTPNDFKISTNIFPSDATFERGTFEEGKPENSTYAQMKLSANNRLRTAGLIEIPGECVLSVASGFKMFICMFNDLGYRKTGNYYPGHVGWTSSPILFPYNSHEGVPKYISLAVAKSNDSSITLDELTNVQVRINAGTTPQPYEPPGIDGWTQGASVSQYTATGWVRQN